MKRAERFSQNIGPASPAIIGANHMSCINIHLGKLRESVENAVNFAHSVFLSNSSCYRGENHLSCINIHLGKLRESVENAINFAHSVFLSDSSSILQRPRGGNHFSCINILLGKLRESTENAVNFAHSIFNLTVFINLYNF